jgi:hypothetical protein
MKPLKIICLGLLLTSIFWSCQEESITSESDPSQFAYFPLKLGKEYIYASDSILIGNGGLYRDTFSSQIREVLKDTFRTVDNELVYLIDRFFRRDTTQSWSPINRWIASVNNGYAYRTEENLKFVKMVFPIVEGKKWEPNRFFDENQRIVVGDEQIKIYPGWRAKYVTLSSPVNVGSQTFDAIHVSVVEPSSNIEHRKVDEYYVKDIGLVKKAMYIYDGDNVNPNESWDKRAKKGFVHTLTLLQYK